MSLAILFMIIFYSGIVFFISYNYGYDCGSKSNYSKSNDGNCDHVYGKWNSGILYQIKECTRCGLAIERRIPLIQGKDL